MADVSPLTIFGNLTADPELRFTRRGQEITNLRVAVNYPEDRYGNQRPTDYWNVEVWGPKPESSNQDYSMARNVVTLEKGDRVIVVGRLKTNSWEDRNGVVHHEHKLAAIEVGPSSMFAQVFAERNQRSEQSEPVRELPSVRTPSAAPDTEEAPF